MGNMEQLYTALGVLHENNKYQEIVDAIESIEEYKYHPRLVSELARAYNNLGKYIKALDLLISIQDEYSEDPLWNFRLAYAYYFLDRPNLAIHYFEIAQSAPDLKEDCDDFIDSSIKLLRLPRFDNCFAERVEKFWVAFQEREEDVRNKIDKKDNNDELLEMVSEIMDILGTPSYFEIGVPSPSEDEESKKYEIVLTFARNSHRAFLYKYLVSKMPDSLKKHWIFVIGRQPSNFDIHMHDFIISSKDVVVNIKQNENEVVLNLYCEKILPLFNESEENAYQLLEILFESQIGEITAASLSGEFNISTEPIEGITLDNVRKELEAIGCDVSNTIEVLTEKYSAYKHNRPNDDDAPEENNIVIGTTRCMPLITEYSQDEEGAIDDLHAFGAFAGHLIFETYADEEKIEKMLDFRYKLADAIQEKVGDRVDIIGGAASNDFYYIDFITYDTDLFLNEAITVFKEAGIELLLIEPLRNIKGYRII